MSNFTDRVMGNIMGGGDDGDNEENPVSPFAGTAQGGQHVGPQEMTPVGPGKDDQGYELKKYECRKCGVIDHAPEYMIEIQNRWGVLCLPCKAPWRYTWKRDPDTGERFLMPTPGGGKPRSRLGEPERRELELRATELLDKKLRREYLRETILKMQAELSEIEPRIVELQTKEIPTAQRALSGIENDPKLEMRQKAADIAHDINLFMSKLAKDAKKTKSVTR